MAKKMSVEMTSSNGKTTTETEETLEEESLLESSIVDIEDEKARKNTNLLEKAAQDNKNQLFAFVALVIVQGLHILFFKLSQQGGEYHYNTASAIAITEAAKFFISFVLHLRDPVVTGDNGKEGKEYHL